MLDAGRVRDAFYRGLIASGHLREKHSVPRTGAARILAQASAEDLNAAALRRDAAAA